MRTLAEPLEREILSAKNKVFLYSTVVYIQALLLCRFCWREVMEAAVFEYHKEDDTVDVESFQGMCSFSKHFQSQSLMICIVHLGWHKSILMQYSHLHMYVGCCVYTNFILKRLYFWNCPLNFVLFRLLKSQISSWTFCILERTIPVVLHVLGYCIYLEKVRQFDTTFTSQLILLQITLLHFRPLNISLNTFPPPQSWASMCFN